MTGPSYVVECPAYTAGPYRSLASAERALAEIERLGACQGDHEIKEVT